MKIKYSELIDQTLYFPTEEFNVEENNLKFHNIPLMEIVEKFGTPLKFNYIPKISLNIQKTKTWFKEAFERNEYTKSYRYCYCTKSSHFKFVLDEALKNDISIETSSAYDMDIVKSLYEEGKFDKNMEVICMTTSIKLPMPSIKGLKTLSQSWTTTESWKSSPKV